MKNSCDKTHEQFHLEINKPHTVSINYNLEIGLTYLGLIVTCVATLFVTQELVHHIINASTNFHLLPAFGTSLFLFLILCLVYGGILYQLTRLAYMKRVRNHAQTRLEDIEESFDEKEKKLTILVPSYKEEKRVVTMTLMSAALQTSPNRRIVLLIDDPSKSNHKEDADNLTQMRALVVKLNVLFQKAHSQFEQPYKSYIQRVQDQSFALETEIRILADLYQKAALWHQDQAQLFNAGDHTEQFFVREILGKRYEKLRVRRKAVLAISAAHDSQPLITHHYKILNALFSVEITSFERKRYENLSHAPNKAMNLNSYIGLIGKSFKERREGALLFLEYDSGASDFAVPDTDYIITLDADSLILPDYALLLMHHAEQPANDKTAVFQTPYSAFPGAAYGKLEYTAGATTDIQYLIHQGFTAYNATFWVGANALLRKEALLDIEETDIERGYPIRRFIQDRTVIEDTESSVDLIEKGWKLYNYPARLSYSATPPDFGSLIIQRQRWANGGLIILPKLFRYFLSGKKTTGKAFEAFMRIHYLFSIAAVNLALVFLLTFPLAEKVPVYWMPFTALFYFINYTRDLKMTGYKTSDIFRVYALNILLVPVNLAGVFKSVQQAWNKKKIPFVRTPKVNGRVSTPPIYLVAVYLLTFHWMGMAGYDLINGHKLHAFFAGLNGFFMLYSIVNFIGVQNSLDDLKNHFKLSGITIPVLSRKMSSFLPLNFLALIAIFITPLFIFFWTIELTT
jgi:cellulose synthase/poly-beta-1,6-N-acetylglucosamine synthase-like glycosyltransferase